MSNGLTGRMQNERKRSRPDVGSLWIDIDGSPWAYKVASNTRDHVYYSSTKRGEGGHCKIDDWFDKFKPLVLDLG